MTTWKRSKRVAHQVNWIAWQVMLAMWHVARQINMLHRSPPKCYHLDHLASAARNLKCREVLSAWWWFPLSFVKHFSFPTIFGYLGYMSSCLSANGKVLPRIRITPGPVQLQKLQFDGSMPALLTGFETHPLDFFQLLVSSSVSSK